MSSSFPPEPHEEPTDYYAPPKTDIGSYHLPGDMGVVPVPFTIADVLARTWEIYKINMGPCIGVVFLAVGVNIGFRVLETGAMVALELARLPQETVIVAQWGLTFGLMILQFWLTVGQWVFMLKLAQGRVVSFGDVFSGGPYLLRTLGATICVGLMVIAILAVGAIPGGVAFLASNDRTIGFIGLGLGVVFTLVAWIIVGVRCSQFQYLIIDRDAGVMDSLRLSMQITRGRELPIIVLGLLGIAINIAGFLACLVGAVFTGPFVMLQAAVTYVALAGPPPGSKPPSHYLSDFDPLHDLPELRPL